MDISVGNQIKEYIYNQNLPLEDREYMCNIPEDELIVFKTNFMDSILILRQLEQNTYELLLQSGYNAEILVLEFLRKPNTILYNYRAVYKQYLKLLEDENYLEDKSLLDIYSISQLSSDFKLKTCLVGLYEV